MSSEFSSVILDALPYQAALLDSTGQILQVNERWVAFCHANGGNAAVSGVGVNYLQVCRAACPGEDHGLPHAAADGIEAVLAGRSTEFELEYLCDAPSQHRRFRLRAIGLAPGLGTARGLVLHEHLQPPVPREPAAHRDGMRIAHALRSPLTTVLGLTELALFDGRHLLPPEQRLRLQRIQSAGESMVALLDGLAAQPRSDMEVSHA